MVYALSCSLQVCRLKKARPLDIGEMRASSILCALIARNIFVNCSNHNYLPNRNDDAVVFYIVLKLIDGLTLFAPYGSREKARDFSRSLQSLTAFS